MWNKAKCILLKTKENSGLLLGLSKFGRLISYDTECTNPNNDAYNVKQHLYIINDDVIKKGDWFIRDGKLYNEFKHSPTPTVTMFIRLYPNLDLSEQWREVYLKDCKKVIATTDKGLVALFGNDEEGYRKQKDGLPQIPQSFIEQYITEYNQGKIIESILVEYEGIEWLDKPLEYFPKINSDNTINTKTVKDSFSREEVVDLINKFERDTCPDRFEGYGTEQEDIDKFIEQNL